MRIPIAKPLIQNQDITNVIHVLQSGHITEGKIVNKLESSLALYCGAQYAVALNSGTAALHAALWALHVQPDDEIITTPFTFIATANAIRMVGAHPVFVDICENSFLIDPEKLEEKITKKTKGIIAVDLFGQPADYKEIYDIAKRHKIFVLDDAAQSIGAAYGNTKCGNIADISCFSFYATKNIMCAEGGMITTNNKQLADAVRIFKNHGQTSRYVYQSIGYNYRLTDILASIVLSQAPKIDTIARKRQQIAAYYSKNLSTLRGIIVPPILPNRFHVFHQYTIRVTDECKYSRNALQQRLAQKGIDTMIYYPTALSEIRHLQQKNDRAVSCPVAQQATREVLSLPIYPSLKKDEMIHIVQSIQSLCGN